MSGLNKHRFGNIAPETLYINHYRLNPARKQHKTHKTNSNRGAGNRDSSQSRDKIVSIRCSCYLFKKIFITSREDMPKLTPVKIGDLSTKWFSSISAPLASVRGRTIAKFCFDVSTLMFRR